MKTCLQNPRLQITSPSRLFACLATGLLMIFTQLWAPAQEAGQTAQTSQTEGTEIYRLQRGDNIAMTIYEEGDMKLSAKIGKSGALSFPLIGSVYVKGYTVPELEQKLRALYQKDYYVDPKVSVLITGYARKTFHVSGAVEHPGSYTYPEEGTINLAQALAMGGGIDPDGNTKAIAVFRARQAGSSTHAISSGGSVIIYPGDTMVVPRLPSRNISYVATVSGEVSKPGNINLGEVGKMDLITALAMAGGYSRIANQKEAIIQRKTKSGSYQIETVRLKDVRDGKAPMVYINEGDILIIKESRW